MRLSELNQKWHDYLASDACPPVLGLAPVNDEELTALTIGLRGRGGEPADILINRLSDYPAAGALWLAAMSAKAYRDGNFWDNFASDTGYAYPAHGPCRMSLRTNFRHTCRAVMSRFTAPLLDSHFHYVEFLFHAGLPLCHVPAFAEAVRRVERREGLPDVSDAEAGEWLRDRVLDQIPQGLETLRKSLVGAAGPTVCEAALRFLHDEGQATVSQALENELERVFGRSDAGGRELRRSARPPFLRLGKDGTSLEICGPAQQPVLFTASGVRWLVEGRVHRVAFGEEMSCAVDADTSVEVQLTGLASGAAPMWKFDLAWPPQGGGFWLFDGVSHRQRHIATQGNQVEVQGGEYWLVHSTDHAVSGVADSLFWEDGLRVSSRVRVKPHPQVDLHNEAGELVVTLQAKAAPLIEWEGSGIITDDSERLLRGSEARLAVWLPRGTEDLGWVLRLECEGEAWEQPLACSEELVGAFVRATSSPADEWLSMLAAGLWLVRASLKRRGHTETTSEALVWQGLGQRTLAGDWTLSALPTNFLKQDSSGFQITAQELRHVSDDRRLHRLAFKIEGATRSFAWAQDGVFLESYERRPGERSWPTTRRLGESFVADIVSVKWLRVWRQPLGAWRVTLGEQTVVAVDAFAPRTFVDISLANLATRFPMGGQLVWHDEHRDVIVARFSRPLSAQQLTLAGDSSMRTLDAHLGEMPSELRLLVRELITGSLVELPTVTTPAGLITWVADSGEPQAAVKLSQATIGGGQLHVELCRDGWPTGLWVAEVELRRDASSTWEPLCSAHGKHLPLVIVQPPTTPPRTYREKAFWEFFGRGFNVPPPIAGLATDPTQLAVMLTEVPKLLARPYHAKEQDYVVSLDSLHWWLIEQAEWLLDQGDGSAEALGDALIDAASSEPDDTARRGLLVSMPHLLALPGKAYASLPPITPQRRALQWIGHLCGYESSAQFFKAAIEPWQVGAVTRLPDVFNVLQRFSNFRQVLNGITGNLELSGFKLTDYFEKTIGPWAGAVHDGEELDEMDVLGKRHAHRVLASARDRLIRHTQVSGMTKAQPLLQSAEFFRAELRQAIEGGSTFIPGNTTTPPWLRCELDDVPALASLNSFCSLLALAMRAKGVGRLSLRPLVTKIITRHGIGSYRSAVRVVHEVAPELLGYYLMLWELVLRTQPAPAPQPLSFKLHA